MTHIPVSNTRDKASGGDHSPGSDAAATAEMTGPPDEIGALARSVIDPRAGRDRGRNLLVVSTVEGSGELLRQYVSPADTIEVVVPVVRQGFLDWLANDESAYAHAGEVAAEAADQLPGQSVGSSAGEADVVLTIRDALATFAADEIILAVRSDDGAGFVESMATKGTPRRSIDGIPVRCILVNEP